MKTKLLVIAFDDDNRYDDMFIHYINGVLIDTYDVVYLTNEDNYLTTLLLVENNRKILKYDDTLSRFIYDGNLSRYINEGYLFTCTSEVLDYIKFSYENDFETIYKQHFLRLNYNPIVSIKLNGNNSVENICELFKNKYNNLHVFKNNKEIYFINGEVNTIMDDFINSINKIINIHDNGYLNIQFKDHNSNIVISLFIDNDKIDGLSIYIDDDINILDKINIYNNRIINNDGLFYKIIDCGFALSLEKMDKQQFIDSSDKYIKFIRFTYDFLLKFNNQ